eukprot:UC1_evm1s422
MGLFTRKRGAVDWKGLKKLNVDKIISSGGEEEADALEDLYEMLVACDPGNALRKDVLKLFRVTQLALELKGEDNRQLEQELIRAEAKIEESSGAGAGGASSFVNAAAEASKVRELQRQLEYAQLDVQHAREEAKTEREAAVAAHVLIAEKEELLTDLEVEYERVQTDASELRAQLSLQRQAASEAAAASAPGGGGGSALAVARNELQMKGRQVNVYVEQLESARSENADLARQVAELTEKLSEAVEHMEEASHRVEELQRGMYAADTKTEKIDREKTVLESQVEDLMAQASTKARSDDEIMVSVKETVNKWKRALGEKDAELAALHEVVQSLQHKLQIEGVDRQADLERQLADRQAEVAMLNSLLERATADMQSFVSKAAAEADGKANTGPAAGAPRGVATTMPELRAQLTAAEEGKRRLERDLAQRDKEVIEQAQRISDYEQGRFGLADAVAQIKAQKTQLEVRDADVARLTKEANATAAAAADLADENEQMRNELGYQQNTDIDLAALRGRRNIEVEQLRATNRLLSKDVERLEAERVELKQKLLAQAMDRGRRAVELGLTQDDLVVAEEFADALSGTLGARRLQQMHGVDGSSGGGGGGVIALDGGRRISMTHQRGTGAGSAAAAAAAAAAVADTVPAAMYTELSERFEALRDENQSMASRVRDADRNVSRAQDETREAQEEARRAIAEMHQGRNAIAELTEALDAVQAAADLGRTVVKLECPAVGQLARALSGAQNVTAGGDAVTTTANGESGTLAVAAGSSVSAAETARLSGANAELRREVVQIRADLTAAQQKLERRAMTVERLTQELDELRVVYTTSMSSQPLHLPPSIPATSRDVVAGLTEQMIQVLNELHEREAELSSVSRQLSEFKREQGVMLHQQALLYEEHNTALLEYEAANEKTSKRIEELEAQVEAENIKNAELKRMGDALLSGKESETARALAEATNRSAALSINERALVRRYEIMVRTDELLRRENAGLRRDLQVAENTVTVRVGFLERHREAAEFTIAELQKRLETSVDKRELEAATRKCDLLASKYKLQLDRQQEQLEQDRTAETLQKRVRELETEATGLRTRVSQLDHKLSLATVQQQQAAEALAMERGEITSTGEPVTGGGNTFVDGRLQTMEMRVTDAQQRAELAVVQRDQAQQAVKALEDRAAALERKFNDVTARNLELQTREKELLDQLDGATTPEQHESDTLQIAELRGEIAALTAEQGRLREVSSVATAQAVSARRERDLQKKEATAMRRQLLELQMDTDDKATIGKLHHHIISLQMSEAEALRKYEHQLSLRLAGEAKLLRTEQALDRARGDLQHTREDTRRRTQYLRETLQSMRTQYAGALRLEEQERYTQDLEAARAAREALETELAAANAKRIAAEDEAAVAAARATGLDELRSAIENRSSGAAAAKQISDWHARLEEVRLRELRLGRQLTRSEDQRDSLQRTLQATEASVRQLEDDSVRQKRKFEDRMATWEAREAELEADLDMALKERAAAQAEAEQLLSHALGEGGTDGILPDPAAPVPQQLEEALHRLRISAGSLRAIKTQLNTATEKAESAATKEEASRAVVLRQKTELAELRLQLIAGPAAGGSGGGAASNGAKDISSTSSSGGSESEGYHPDLEERNHRHHLHLARETVRSLQTLLEQKEQALQRSRDLLASAHAEHEAFQQAHYAEYRRLQDRLLDVEKRRAEEVGHAATIAATEGSSSGGGGGTTGSAVDAMRAEIARLAQESEDQAEALKSVSVRARSAEQELESARGALSAAQRELAAVRAEASAESEAHAEATARLVALLGAQKTATAEAQSLARDAEARAEAAPAARTVERVKRQAQQLKQQQRELAAAKAALNRLREELAGNAEAVLALAPDSVNAHGRLEAAAEGMGDRLDATGERVQRVQRRLGAYKEEIADLRRQLVELRGDTAEGGQQQGRLQVLEGELELRTQELADARARLAKVEAERSDKGGGMGDGGTDSNSSRAEVNVLRRRLAAADAKLATVQNRAGLDATVATNTKVDKIAASTARWQADKDTQRRLDSLRARLREKEQAMEQVEVQLERARTTIERLDRDRAALQAKLRAAGAANSAAAADTELQRLQSEVFTLQEAARDNRRAVNAAGVAELAALARVENIRGVAGALARHMDSTKVTQIYNEYGVERVADGMGPKMASGTHAAQMLEARKQVMALKFELEEARVEAPRLRERIRELEDIVRVLNERAAEARATAKQAAAKSKNGGKGGGVGDKTDLASAQREIRRLRTQVQETKRKGEEEGRRAMAKLKLDYDRVREHLRSERESCARTQRQLSQLKTTHEAQSAALEALRAQVSATNQGSANREAQERESASARLEEMAQLRIELEAGKAQLRAARAQEEHLMREMRVLESAVSEGGGDGGGGETEPLTQECQQLREAVSVLRSALATSRAECEELNSELSAFDPAFFEEIEQLRRNYEQAREQLGRYEAELLKLAVDYGVATSAASPVQG